MLPGVFTNKNGTYVKVEDVEYVIDSLRGSPPKGMNDKAFFEGYYQALEHLRLEVRNGV